MASKGPGKGANTLLYELLVEWWSGHPTDDAGSQFMQRGTDLEGRALAAYEWEHDATVERVGFCTTDDGLLGCSPDGLVGESGLVQVKILGAKAHIAALLGTYDDHKPQIQCELAVTGRDWSSLWLWNPDLPCLAIRAERDEEYIEAMLENAAAFEERLRDSQDALIRRGVAPRQRVDAATKAAESAEFDRLVEEAKGNQ